MAEETVYRLIDPEDLPTVFDVRVATWHNERGREELNEFGITYESVHAMLYSRNPTHRGWLCEVGNKVVGFAMGNQETGEMWVIAVLKEFESRGIGRRLLELIEEWLFDQGWDEIWLTTDPDEAFRAVGFYRHLGWKDWKFEDGDRFMRKTRPN